MLSERLVTDVLLAALSTGGDFAEIFMEDTYSTNIRMLDGKVEEGVSGRDYGVGIRIFHGFRSVYAYTNDSSRENLMKVALEAAAALQGAPSRIQWFWPGWAWRSSIQSAWNQVK